MDYEIDILSDDDAANLSPLDLTDPDGFPVDLTDCVGSEDDYDDEWTRDDEWMYDNV